jgi:hypothetical protein
MFPTLITFGRSNSKITIERPDILESAAGYATGSKEAWAEVILQPA